ncbi:MAG: heterodisulfide reductase-related iron-sulfur binding cluster [Thiogranum sp.]
MSVREGSLDAPTRHPLDWQSPEFYDEASLLKELERVYDICHGCRRCFSLCNAFPTLFDAIDESDSMELDSVDKRVFWQVVDHCYLCDMCYMTKCPYVPPHEWNVDFPHLMLRAKAVKHRQGKTGARDRMLSSTDLVGRLASIPVVSSVVNRVNKTRAGRAVVEELFEVHPQAHLPEYHSRSLRKRIDGSRNRDARAAPEAGPTRGKVALFATCYGNYNEPELGEDLIAVFEHNDLPVRLVDTERCCGMPKLEQGDLEAVAKAKQFNVPRLVALVDEGWDIVAPVPSCVLMFKQELPLMFPDDPDVAKLRDNIYDPFEYLAIRHKHDLLKIDFKRGLGRIAYHVACHLRVQNMGMKTRDLLQLVPDTSVDAIERCSGHDGTYAVKKEFHEVSMKICKPVVSRVQKSHADHYCSDCPMAGHQIENGLADGSRPEHPLKLLRMAYGI